MKCAKAKNLMSSYLDGEISAAERESFEDHVRGCAACGRTLAELAGVNRLFAEASRFKTPPGFSRRVMAAAEAEPARASFWTPGVIGLAEAVVLLAVIVSGTISGSILARGVSPASKGGAFSAFALDFFDPAPPDSLAGVYLAMTETTYEQ